MSYVGKERPGVYSDYKSSSILWGNPTGKTVGLVAESSKAAGSVNIITRSSDADSIFGTTGLMSKLCKIILQNGAIKVAAVSAGTNNYDKAFDTIKSLDDICVVVCDSENVSVHDKLKSSIVSASEDSKERIGIVSYPSSSYTSGLGSHFNCERIIVIAQSPVDSDGEKLSSCYLSAAFAGLISQNSDPSLSFNGKSLNSIFGLTSNLIEDKVDEYIESGITPFESISNQVEIIRAVSSRTTTNNITDLTFKDINTILIIDYVISGIRKTLSKLLEGAKNNSSTRSAIATQVTVELEKYKSEEIIDKYEQPSISKGSSDQSVCIVNISFEVSRGINQIYITADVRV